LPAVGDGPHCTANTKRTENPGHMQSQDSSAFWPSMFSGYCYFSILR